MLDKIEASFVRSRGEGVAHIVNHAKTGTLCGREDIDVVQSFVYAPADPPLCKACLGPGRPVKPHGSGG